MAADGAAGSNRRAAVAAAAAAVALAAAAVGVATQAGDSTPEGAARPTVTSAPTPPPTPTPTPTPTAPGPSAAEDLSRLPVIDVFAVNPRLPLDDAPEAPLEPFTARPARTAVPVFAEPGGEPVGQLPAAQRYGGTAVPVVARDGDWVRVLLVGRQSLPGRGDPGQVAGWVRAGDVALTANPLSVEVSLSERTIRIVAEGAAEDETVATDFASGASATPTPTGRSFIMLTEPVPSFSYTRGHPLVYLSVQSPTLAGFDGQPVAVTALHYHDVRSGAISNGCIRVDASAIERLAQLPAGTPVYLRP